MKLSFLIGSDDGQLLHYCARIALQKVCNRQNDVKVAQIIGYNAIKQDIYVSSEQSVVTCFFSCTVSIRDFS